MTQACCHVIVWSMCFHLCERLLEVEHQSYELTHTLSPSKHGLQNRSVPNPTVFVHKCLMFYLKPLQKSLEIKLFQQENANVNFYEQCEQNYWKPHHLHPAVVAVVVFV